MNISIKPKFILIPGVSYRVRVDDSERELIFMGRYDQGGKAHLQWRDSTSQITLNQETGQPGFDVVRMLS